MSPGQLDPAVVRRHLLALDAAVARLRTHAGKPIDALRGDQDELWAVERGLQLCAQNCVDLATHLAASAGHDVVDYASAIDRLADLGALPGAFAARFRAVAGLRNILVHGYLQVDLGKLHALLNTRLDDFVELAAHLEAYLRQASAPA